MLLSGRAALSTAMSSGILAGKVAVVTGSTEGIGYSVARRLAFDGASVMVSSRKEINVNRAVQTLQNQGLNVAGTVCHAGREEDRARLLEKTQQMFGGIDILVCNAAVNPFIGNILESKGDVWDKIFDVNVKCTFLITKESVPYMKKRGGGSVVIVSSITGYQPIPEIGPYSVSKSALLALTKTLAPALADHNIRVNSLVPGIIRTHFSSFLWSNEENLGKMLKRIPLKRIGEPDECAGTVSFLCSPDASYITGESVVVAGGLLSTMEL